MLAGPYTRRKRTRSDAARRAMKHRTVRSVAAAEGPAFHATLKTFALAHSGNVHKLANFEMIHQDSVARLGFILGVVDPKFANVSQRRHACFFEMSGQC